MNYLQYSTSLLIILAVSCHLVNRVACQQTTTNAKLLVDKEILNKYIVEGRDLVVNYHLINIGGSNARDVKVIDDSFPAERFEIVNGYTKFTIPLIAPGANVSHAVVLRPKQDSWGPYRSGPAKVEYKLNDAGQLQLGTSSEFGDAYVVAARVFDKKFSSQFLDWFVFMLLCVPSIAGPYYLWFKSDSKLSNQSIKQAGLKK